MTDTAIFGPGFSGLGRPDQLRRVATEFEAVVLAQLLSGLRKTVPKGGLFGQSASEEIFQSMLDSELARVTAERSPFGLADAMVKRFAGEPTAPENPRATESLPLARGPRLRGVG